METLCRICGWPIEEWQPKHTYASPEAREVIVSEQVQDPNYPLELESAKPGIWGHKNPADCKPTRNPNE